MARTRKHPGNGRVETVPWREDPLILFRLDWVRQFWFELPLTSGLRLVNNILTSNDRNKNPHGPLPPIGLEQYKTDREHCLILFRETVATGMDSHYQNFALMRDTAMRYAQQGSTDRASNLAVAIRAEESMSRLDGSWALGAGGELPPVEQPAQRFLPSPRELLADGHITKEQYRMLVRVRRLESSPEALPPAKGEIIDAEPVREPARRPPRRKPAPSKQTAAPPPPAFPRPAARQPVAPNGRAVVPFEAGDDGR